MAMSVFELFKVGLGPSSSHTVGPMKAANLFVESLEENGFFASTDRIIIELYGSLALTGVGHGTHKAVMLGLEGYRVETVDPQFALSRPDKIAEKGQLFLAQRKNIAFAPQKHLIYHKRKSLPAHPNGMTFKASKGSASLYEKTYYSVGGGFVIDEAAAKADVLIKDTSQLPYPFQSGKELLDLVSSTGLTISEIMFKNEVTWRTEAQIRAKLKSIWQEMYGCIERGLGREGVLPGGLSVARRAKKMHAALLARTSKDPLRVLDWVNLYALSVNEENAAGSRVVTAPTNGAAGVIPALIRYYLEFCGGDEEGVLEFFLTAGAVGILYAQNASISGAEVGCQGEVGVACSMAAAGLTACMGGDARQVTQAAEIGMEHNLGLTCDPVGGLVQIPCIERNAMGAIKAINASRIALSGNGEHHVSLDSVIKTMKQTGKDMKDKYKETSRGGLAVNVTEC